MISIIFSTYNGEKTLPLMLDALLKLTPPKGGWELIAVNNNSSDNTETILQQYLSQLPLQILFEVKKGKNNALNRAIEHIQGDIVVFTDDDVIPSPDWLEKIRTIVDREQSYAIFGGKIEPYWSTPPNQWNNEWIQMGIVYAITAESNIAGEIGAGFIWGANMVIRREIFNKGYTFNSAIGPDGTNNYAMGSETSFTLMLEREGYKCWFEPSCIVKHIIKESQMSAQWVLSRATRFGRGEAKKLNVIEEKNKNVFLFGAPRYLYRKIFDQYINLCIEKLFFKKELAFKTQWEINFLKGVLIGFRDKMR